MQTIALGLSCSSFKVGSFVPNCNYIRGALFSGHTKLIFALIAGKFGNILYTGDFRYSHKLLDNPVLSPIIRNKVTKRKLVNLSLY